MVQHNG